MVRGGIVLTATRLDGFVGVGQAVVRWVACDVVPDRWLAALDRAEQGRAGRFHFAADRASYIAAHALGRHMLAMAGGLPAADWRFCAGPFGKPEVDPGLGRPSLRFNLSHTRGMAACIVAHDMEVGVDVEALDRRNDGLAIADRFFRPEEACLIDGPRAFLRLWTLKESVMKATGEGFHLPLDAYAVTLEPPGVRFAEGERGPWSFHQQDAGAGHLVTAAARAPGVVFDCAAVDADAMGAA